MPDNAGNIVLQLLVWLVEGVVRLIKGNKESKRQNIFKRDIAMIKLTSTRITVDLKDCKIKSSEYMDTPYQGDPGDIGAIDVFTGDYRQRPANEFYPKSVLVYEWSDEATHIHKNFVSDVFNKDAVTTAFYLDKQKQTTVYFDRENDAYYFDIEFLKRGL